jgi:hypothetical protein
MSQNPLTPPSSGLQPEKSVPHSLATTNVSSRILIFHKFSFVNDIFEFYCIN